jgi:hypothetical protein
MNLMAELRIRLSESRKEKDWTGEEHDLEFSGSQTAMIHWVSRERRPLAAVQSRHRRGLGRAIAANRLPGVTAPARPRTRPLKQLGLF